MVFYLCIVDLYITTCIEKILHMLWICQIYVKMVNNHESSWINTQMWYKQLQNDYPNLQMTTNSKYVPSFTIGIFFATYSNLLDSIH